MPMLDLFQQSRKSRLPALPLRFSFVDGEDRWRLKCFHDDCLIHAERIGEVNFDRCFLYLAYARGANLLVGVIASCDRPYVAEDEGEDSEPEMIPQGYIPVVYVRREWRQRGIADRLYQFARRKNEPDWSPCICSISVSGARFARRNGIEDYGIGRWIG